MGDKRLLRRIGQRLRHLIVNSNRVNIQARIRQTSCHVSTGMRAVKVNQLFLWLELGKVGNQGVGICAT